MFIKIAAGVVAAVILFAIVYVLYVVLQYRRIEDEKTLEIENPETEKVRADRKSTRLNSSHIL